MTPLRRADLVPLTERLVPVRWMRAAIAAFVVVAALTGATPLTVAPELLVAVSVLLVVGLTTIDELWRRTRTAATGQIGLLLVIDGLYLAWAGTVTGGADGIVSFLVLLHVAGVTLLVSHRTGVKIALWHSLLLYGTHELDALGAIASGGLGSQPYSWLLAFTAVLWLVTLATASWSAVNERELRRRRADLEALAEFATELQQADDPTSVARALADRLHDVYGFPRILVLGGDERLVVLGSAGVPPTNAAVPAVEPDSILHRACHQRRTQMVASLAGKDAGLASLLPDARNLLVVPLLGEGGILGVVVAEHGPRRGGRIEQRVVSSVERFVDHAALALRAAGLRDALHRLATVDGLTGTANRRAFDEVLSGEVSRALRAAQSARPGGPAPQQLALLLLDVDHFKAVNDTHGHQVGDDVLRALAATLMTASRDFDTVARYGGEEFAVIVPGCDVHAARAAAERMRREIEQAPTAVPVTVSIGIALAPGHGHDPETLVKAADDALRTAKAAGRNRVVVAAGTAGPRALSA